MRWMMWMCAVVVMGCVAGRAWAEEEKMPPGWLPVSMLDGTVGWKEFKDGEGSKQPHLFLPEKVENVRGIFVCYVFHSADPRQIARSWQFALVTIPTAYEYDIGYFDKRNKRGKETGLPVGNMGVLLRYLDEAAKQTKHPELGKAPIVGWVGQNGAGLCNDLYTRAPERVLAWADGWYESWAKYPELVAHVPIAAAWEFNEKDRTAKRAAELGGVEGKATPPRNMTCFATTYGFGHGIYSKWNFFVAYMDRCIADRLPEVTPPAGEAVKLKPMALEKGWAGDFNLISEWNAVVPYGEAKGMVAPTWMPDAYAAAMWRAYHSAKPDVKLQEPVIEYHRGRGEKMGLGYDAPVKAEVAQMFAAETTGNYVKMEFYDGDKLLGTAEAAPWEIKDVKLAKGLRTLYAVGVTAEGKRSASHPGFLIVE